MPRQKLVDFFDRMSRYFLEHSFHPFEGVDVMQLACTQQRVEHSATLCGFMAASEQVIFSSDGNRTDGIFYWGVVDIEFSIGGIDH